MTLLKNTGLALAIAGLTACAGQPVDNSPAYPTTVLKAKYLVNGLYAPDFHGEQIVYTRADRRRLDHKTEFDSFLMRWANFDSSDIARLDRKLWWAVDHDDETYRECAITGCIDGSIWDQLSKSDTKEEDEEEYESYDERGCQVKLATNQFTVTPTGNQRLFGGMNANEYKVEWRTEMADPTGAKDLNLVQFVFWTITPDTQMHKAWQVNREFQQAYLGENPHDPLMRLLGKDGYMAIAAFAGDVQKTDAEQYGSFLSELNKIEGYPLSIKLEWYQKNDACQNPATAGGAQPVNLSNGLEGAAMNMVNNFFKEQKAKVLAEWNKDARVRYIYEVVSVNEEMVRDSAFDLPAGYKMMDRQ